MISVRLKEHITHPIFISLIIWVILVLLIPPIFSKYRIKHVRDEYTSVNVWDVFLDYDNDNMSERISFDLNDLEQTKIIVTKNNKILDQYDLKYQPAGIQSVYTGDYNNDGYLECYVYTMNQDSIFLNVIDPYKLRKTIITKRFIDFRRKASQSVDTPSIETVGMIEGNNSNFNDLIFIISTGYSKQPRKLYRYLISEDSLIKSPESSIVLTDCHVTDINNDYLPEFILNVLATGNYEEDVPYTDRYSWLMVMDHKLRFLFPPVKFSRHPSRLLVIPLKFKNYSRLIVFNDYVGIDSVSSSFNLMDIKGNRISEKPLMDFENSNSEIFINRDYNKNTFYFLKNRNAQVDEIDTNFTGN